MKLRTILVGTLASLFLVSVASSTELGSVGNGGCGSYHVAVA